MFLSLMDMLISVSMFVSQRYVLPQHSIYVTMFVSQRYVLPQHSVRPWSQLHLSWQSQDRADSGRFELAAAAVCDGKDGYKHKQWGTSILIASSLQSET